MTGARHRAERVDSEFGDLQIWVNDAGIYPLVAFLDITDKDWGRVSCATSRILNLSGTLN